MTSFSSSSFSFSNIYSSSSETYSVVTREEFNAFHSIDRNLFSRFIFGLKRDMKQSYDVLGFLLLLEQIGYARNLNAYLVSLQDAFIDAVANEIVVCLSVLRNQHFPSTFFDDDNSIVPLMIRLTGGKLSLRFLHQNTEIFLFGLRKNLNDVCKRAFEDICERYNREKLMALERERVIEQLRNIRLSVQQETPIRLNVQQEAPIRLSFQRETPIRLNNVQQETPIRLSIQEQVVHALPPPVIEETNKTPEEVTETEKGKAKEEEEEEEAMLMAADDRTVFLTFSKGYPITEDDVRVYFTRRYGEVIEAVEMQEVEDNEQPLYAKMVLKTHCASKLEEIVSARNRNKFTIDGKHVWARKYVAKNPSAASSSHI